MHVSCSQSWTMRRLLSPILLLVLCWVACVNCKFARPTDPCATSSAQYGKTSAAVLTAACQKCSYLSGRNGCLECLSHAADLPGSLSDRASIASQCLSYLSVYPKEPTMPSVACMIAASQFPTKLVDSYAYCMSCAYSWLNSDKKALNYCYTVFKQAVSYDAAIQQLVSATGLSTDTANVTYKLPPLSYAYDALEPYFDNRTMFIHHTLHHAAYIKSLNTVLEGTRAKPFRRLPLVTVLAGLGGTLVPPDLVTTIRNGGGGHWNHAFFWTVLAPPNTTAPSSTLLQAINDTFGSFDAFKTAFTAAATGRFGSGWAWLVYDPDCTTSSQPPCKPLLITSTPNQDNPLMENLADVPGIPILGLDVWEHAYYLKNQNRRADYIAAFWNVINWSNVETYLNAAKQGRAFAVLPDIKENH